MKVVNRVEESELAPSGQVTSCLRANAVQFHRTEPVVTNREPVCKVLPGTIISLPTTVLCCIFNVYQNDYRVLQATTCVVNDPMLDSSTNADMIFPCTTKIDTLSGMLSVRVRPYGGCTWQAAQQEPAFFFPLHGTCHVCDTYCFTC